MDFEIKLKINILKILDLRSFYINDKRSSLILLSNFVSRGVKLIVRSKVIDLHRSEFLCRHFVYRFYDRGVYFMWEKVFKIKCFLTFLSSDLNIQ